MILREDASKICFMAAHRPSYDPHHLRRVSVEALVDPRTAARFLNGRPVRPSISARIASALARIASAASPDGSLADEVSMDSPGATAPTRCTPANIGKCSGKL